MRHSVDESLGKQFPTNKSILPPQLDYKWGAFHFDDPNLAVAFEDACKKEDRFSKDLTFLRNQPHLRICFFQQTPDVFQEILDQTSETIGELKFFSTNEWGSLYVHEKGNDRKDRKIVNIPYNLNADSSKSLTPFNNAPQSASRNKRWNSLSFRYWKEKHNSKKRSTAGVRTALSIPDIQDAIHLTAEWQRKGLAWPPPFFFLEPAPRISPQDLERFTNIPLDQFAHADSTLFQDLSSSNFLPFHHPDAKPLIGQITTMQTGHGDNLIVQKALDTAQKGDILFIDGGGHKDIALIGGLVHAVAEKKQFDFICHGAIRDVENFQESVNVRCHALWFTPKGPTKEGPGALHLDLEIEGKEIHDGDLIHASGDRIVIVRPQNLTKLLKSIKQQDTNKQKASLPSFSISEPPESSKSAAQKQKTPLAPFPRSQSTATLGSLIQAAMRPLPPSIAEEFLEPFQHLPTANLSDAIGKISSFNHIGGTGLRRYGSKMQMTGTAITVRGGKQAIETALKNARPRDILVIGGSDDDENECKVLFDDSMVDLATSRQLGGIVVNGTLGAVVPGIPCYAYQYVEGEKVQDGLGNTGGGVPIGTEIIEEGQIVVGDTDGVIGIPPKCAGTVLEIARMFFNREADAEKNIQQGNIQKAWVNDALILRGVDQELVSGKSFNAPRDPRVFKLHLAHRRPAQGPRGWGGLEIQSAPRQLSWTESSTPLENKADILQAFNLPNVLEQGKFINGTIETLTFDSANRAIFGIEERANVANGMGKATGNTIYVTGLQDEAIFKLSKALHNKERVMEINSQGMCRTLYAPNRKFSSKSESFLADERKFNTFVQTLLGEVGVAKESARATADALVSTDMRGIASHGTSRLRKFYIPRLLSIESEGRINPKPNIQILHNRPTNALIDADNGLGHLAAEQAMKLAIEKANAMDIAIVSVRNSNHLGALSHYARMAVQEEMACIAMTDASRSVVPMNGSERMYGTNPLAIAVPSKNEPPFIFDSSSSACSFGHVRRMAAEDRPLKPGQAVDAEGQETLDPAEVFNGGALLPTGGREDGHKGYGQGVSVSLLTAVLAGGAIGTDMPLQNDSSQSGKVSHTFIVFKPGMFRPLEDFEQDVDRVIRELKESRSAPNSQERVRVPGERSHYQMEHSRDNGIPLSSDIVKDLEKLANDFKIPFDITRSKKGKEAQQPGASMSR